MAEQGRASIVESFADLEDPRVMRSRLHELTDILTVALCAMLCGAEDWESISSWGRIKLDWLRKYLPLENGIPSHDADSFLRLGTDAVIGFGGGRNLSDCRGCALALRATADRRFGGTVDAHKIYRTCLSRRFRPEVPEIRLPGSTRRPKIALVAVSSAVQAVALRCFCCSRQPGLGSGRSTCECLKLSGERCRIQFY